MDYKVIAYKRIVLINEKGNYLHLKYEMLFHIYKVAELRGFKKNIGLVLKVRHW